MTLRESPARSGEPLHAIPLPARLGGAFLLSCLTLSGCTALDEVTREDAERVAADVRNRVVTDAEIARLEDDRAAIEARVTALVAHPLTLDSALRIAMLQAPSLRSTLAELGIARVEAIQVGLLSNPAFDFNTKFFSDGAEIEFGVSQSLLDVFLLPLRKRAAAARFAAIEAVVTREIVHAAHEARRNFLRVQAAQALEALAKSKVDSARASLELMQRLHDAGNVTDAMLTEQTIALTRAELDLDHVHLELLETRADFDLALGLRGNDTHWTILDPLPSDALVGLNLDDIEARAVRNSLDLAVVDADIESSGYTTTLVRRQSLIPDLTAGIAGKREAVGGTGVGPSLGMALPLFDDGSARVAAAELRRQRHLNEQLAVATRIEIESRRLRDRVVALAKRVSDLESKLVPTHARHVHEILQQYNAMQIGAFTVLDARHDELDAQRELLIALRETWLARVDLEELLQGALLR